MQPKKEAPPKKEKGGKEGGKPQEKKEKKKEEKKPAQEEEMDDCDAVLAAEPKTKDPFAHLPKRFKNKTFYIPYTLEQIKT